MMNVELLASAIEDLIYDLWYDDTLNDEEKQRLLDKIDKARYSGED